MNTCIRNSSPVEIPAVSIQTSPLTTLAGNRSNLIHKLIVGKNVIVLLEQKEEPTNNVRKVEKLSNCSLYVCSLNSSIPRITRREKPETKSRRSLLLMINLWTTARSLNKDNLLPSFRAVRSSRMRRAPQETLGKTGIEGQQ